jgi:hypothetical protein
VELDPAFFEAAGKAIGAIIGIGIAGYQAYAFGIRGFRGRATLRRDLEILKMLDPGDLSHAILKAHVNRFVATLYAPPLPPLHKRLMDKLPWPKKMEEFVPGLILFLIFVIWTATLNMEGFSWWSLLTGFIALCGFSLMASSFDDTPTGARTSGKVPTADPIDHEQSPP